jgi:hypothetical protein
LQDKQSMDSLPTHQESCIGCIKWVEMVLKPIFLCHCGWRGQFWLKSGIGWAEFLTVQSAQTSLSNSTSALDHHLFLALVNILLIEGKQWRWHHWHMFFWYPKRMLQGPLWLYVVRVQDGTSIALTLEQTLVDVRTIL